MTWIKNAMPGDLVICVDDDVSHWTTFDLELVPNRVRVNEIYRIRLVGLYRYYDGESIGLLFDEVINPIIPEVDAEHHWIWGCFRPVSPIATALFQRLTAPRPRINVKDLVE